MENVFHVTGPPGTGKTHFLADATREAVLIRGRRVAIASLTNTAAREIRDRTEISDRSMVAVGTLHKLCMEALGVSAGELVAGHGDEWNEHPGVKSRGWNLTRKDSVSEGRRASETRGDRLLARLEDSRQRMIPRPRIVGLPEFEAAYTAWKRESGYHDFTDLVERAAAETTGPVVGGHAPDTLVLDECQDSTRLELHLVREVWGPNVERVILAGDPDQTLYGFRSADPRVFLDFEVPERHAKTLAQSYRVPRVVQAYAQGIIRRIRDRVDVAYAPREEEGEVLRHRGTAKVPERLLPDLERWLGEGTVMVLAATEFSLRPLVSVLRKAGIPFGNPWAPKRGDWNPLRPSVKGKVSTRDRFLAYLAPGKPEWTREDLLKWLPLLQPAGTLARGVATTLTTRLSDPWTSEEFVSLFQQESDAVALYARSPNPLFDRARSEKRRLLDYLGALYARGGEESLTETPRLTIGTVHSVKGAAADTVVVFPDVTPAMYRAAATREGMDTQTRTFYVAATRARSRLVLCTPTSRMAYAL